MVVLIYWGHGKLMKFYLLWNSKVATLRMLLNQVLAPVCMKLPSGYDKEVWKKRVENSIRDPGM